MKKILTLVAALACTLGAFAIEYTGVLTVSINQESTEQAATVNIDKNDDGTFTFSLKNFVLDVGTQRIGVGNIVLPDNSATETYGFNDIKINKTISIENGDDPTIPYWLGPTLPPVPIDLKTKFNDTAITVHIDIDMKDIIGQMIVVDFVGAAPAKGGSVDINGDGTVDVEDMNKLINAMLGKE